MAKSLGTTSILKPNSSDFLPPFRSLDLRPELVKIVPRYGLSPSLQISYKEIKTYPMASFVCKSQSSALLAHPAKYTKRALIIVRDKSNLAFLARGLRSLGYTIFSTGETATALHEAGVLVTEKALIELLFEFENKGDQKPHNDTHQAGTYDVLVVDSLPFSGNPSSAGVSFERRVKCKAEYKFLWLDLLTKINEDSLVVVDPQDYCSLLDHLEENLEDKKFRRILNLKLSQFKEAIRSSFHMPKAKRDFQGYGSSLATAIQHHGKEMSRERYMDANVAWNCVSDFVDPTCVVVQNIDPCGVASRDNILEAHKLAFKRGHFCTSYGGGVAFNVEVDETLASQIRDFWFPVKEKIGYEVVVAPAYSQKGLEILCGISKDLTVLEAEKKKMKEDGLFVDDIKFKNVSEKCPTKIELDDVKFAWHCVRHSMMNFVVAKNKCLLGKGALAKIASLEYGLRNAIRDSGEEAKGAVLASDLFCPSDRKGLLKTACESGVSVIVGRSDGGIGDEEAIECCNKYGVSLLFAEASNSQQ